MTFSDQGPFSDDWDENDEVEIPFADPSIREDYAAALGRLILAHNECDYWLAPLIECCFKRLNNPPNVDLAQTTFARRLEILQMLQSIPFDLRISSINFRRIGELNTHRNRVAHGHFDQNPFSGDYDIVTIKDAYKKTRQKMLRKYTSAFMDEVTLALQGMAQLLSATVIFYDGVTLPDGATPLGQASREPS